MTTTAPNHYPLRFDVEYPERLSRLSTLFRIILVIPIAFVIGAVGAFQVIAPLLMILFRRKYPRWWFDWNLELSRFNARYMAYWSLLRDEYPSTDEAQAVHLEIDYPDVPRDLNRVLPLFKWLLAIPHYIVLWILLAVGSVAILLAWIWIIITGRYPRFLFRYVVGVHRWALRVAAYAFLMVTDRYPPFSLR